MNNYPKVYIIILNYNGWADTIECLESVLRNDYPNYQVIVVDNNSPDNSMEYIKAWAEGKLDVWVKPDHPLKSFSFPPVKKPIPYIYYIRNEAEDGGNPELENNLVVKFLNSKRAIIKPINQSTTQSINYSTCYPLILIQTGENLGFSGGNNVGIRYALAKGDFEYVWLLNNDTVIKKYTLKKLVHFGKTTQMALIGSKLYYYDKPGQIQAFGGGKHIAILGINKNIKKECKLDYITGASILILKDIIKKVGLWDEEYFLNHEDIDYSVRTRQIGFRLAVCKDAVVYHKETVTIGKKSFISIYYRTRNTFLLIRKHYPYFLPVVLVFNLLKIAKGIINRNKIYLHAVGKAYRDFFKGSR